MFLWLLFGKDVPLRWVLSQRNPLQFTLQKWDDGFSAFDLSKLMRCEVEMLFVEKDYGQVRNRKLNHSTQNTVNVSFSLQLLGAWISYSRLTFLLQLM